VVVVSYIPITTEAQRTHRLHREESSILSNTASQREFLPAAGRDVFLPLYDPLVSLMGFGRAAEDLIDEANIERGHSVLDLGCGTGTLILMLRRRYTGVVVIGLDPDAKVLQRASNKFKRAGMSVQLDLGFSDQLPYEEKSFDRVFSSFMFHHLDEQERERTAREVSRVLKPTGTFHLLDFVADPAKDGFWDRLIESHALMKTNTDERLLQLIGRAGFTNVTKVKEGSMLFGLMRTSYFRASV